jgi:hypothetical protein
MMCSLNPGANQLFGSFGAIHPKRFVPGDAVDANNLTPDPRASAACALLSLLSKRQVPDSP